MKWLSEKEVRLGSKPVKPRWKQWVRLAFKIFGGAFGLVLLYWFARGSNLQGVWEKLREIHVFFFLLIAATAVGYLLVTISWQLSFMKMRSSLTLTRLMFVRLAGETLAQINPTNLIAGETLKAILLKRKGVPYKDSILSLTVSRFLIILSSLTLIIVGASLFFDSLNAVSSFATTSIGIGVLCIICTALIILLHSAKGFLYIPLSILKRMQTSFRFGKRLTQIIVKLEEVNAELIIFYKRKKFRFFVAYILSFIHWFFGALEFYLILRLLNYSPTFLACISIEVGVMVFKALGSFIPGQIGIEEYGNKLMLAFSGIPGGDVWIPVSILRRARQLFWIGTGVVAFFFLIKKEKELNDGSIVYNT